MRLLNSQNSDKNVFLFRTLTWTARGNTTTSISFENEMKICAFQSKMTHREHESSRFRILAIFAVSHPGPACSIFGSLTVDRCHVRGLRVNFEPGPPSECTGWSGRTTQYMHWLVRPGSKSPDCGLRVNYEPGPPSACTGWSGVRVLRPNFGARAPASA